jgi:hypothetical protein
MYYLRRKWSNSRLQPEFRFVRTLLSPHHVIPDERTGLYRISSKAFGPSSSDGTLSGDLEQILAADGLSPIAMYPALPDPVGAASITVGQLRGLGAKVEHDPDKYNWYHGAVTGTKSKGTRKALSEIAVEIVAIDQLLAARLEQSWKANQRSSAS